VTSTTDVALTREKIKAIRNAEVAVFRWKADDHGAGTLVLTKTRERTDGFGPDELRVEVPTIVGVQNYGSGGSPEAASNLAPATSGSWAILDVDVRAEWNTMANQLREGDTLVQEWIVDNRNDLLMHARLTMHELKVRVERPMTDGRTRVYRYLLAAAVRDPFGMGDQVKRQVS